MGMLDDGEAQRRLGYHPAQPNTVPAYELNRSGAILLFEVWNRVLPPGRETALALTALQEALMWANAAVACNAGDEWQLEPVDVSVLLDELAEKLEGPLHIRTRVAGGGGPVGEGSGGDIGPESGQIGDAEPGSGLPVPEAGLAATHLTPEQVQGLIERSGPRGPADDLARRSGGETVTLIDPDPRARWVPGVGRVVEPPITGPNPPVEPVEGADRLLRGACTSRDPFGDHARCELVAGHRGEHRSSSVARW